MSAITACLWRRYLCRLIDATAAFGFVSYHTSHILSSDRKTAFKRLRTLSVKSNAQLKPAAGIGKSTQVKDMWHSRRSAPKQLDKRATVTVSSELQKLALDDELIAARKDGTVNQKSSIGTEESHWECVFGISPCLLAITHRRRKISGLFVKKGDTTQRKSMRKVCEEAHRHGVPIHHVSKRELDKMAPGCVHQGVCVQASPLTYVTEEKQCRSHSRKDKNLPPLWLVLENVQDPMNLGAILRSAYFLGVDRVVSSIAHSCPLSPVVSKASSGTMEAMDVYGHENLGEMLRVKKANGWDVVGTVGAESGEAPVITCSDFKVTKPTLLLIGGEGGGLSNELQTVCQTILTIPAGRQLFTGIESLNVSVATGILLYSLLLSRSSSKSI